MKLENIDKLIELNEKMAVLLKEYKESQKYESCEYHVIKDAGQPYRYMLFEINKTKEGTNEGLVKYGNHTDIIHWLEKRKISPDVVYHYELLEKAKDTRPNHDRKDWWNEQNF